MNKVKILFLGTQGFPYGMAEVEKQTLIARSLVEEGCKVTFVCNKSFNFQSKLSYKGNYKNIHYIYTNFYSRRLKNRLFNSISWLLGEFVEVLYLLISSYDLAILNSRDYSDIKKYSTILHLRKKKLFLTFTEDIRSMYPNADRTILKKIKDFENKTWNIIDGVFPISEELIRQVKERNFLLPMLKIPVLVDLKEAENYKIPDEIPEEGYILFCGSSDYYETIDFIISGFEKANVNVFLFLIINGNTKSMTRVKERVDGSISKNKIVIKTALIKELLWGYYLHAEALLIPLNFNQRDKARFPHKIGEYCASGSAIITSNWGEIPQYFIHGSNCLMLKTNKTEELAYLIEIISSDHILLKRLKQNSRLIAINNFDYQSYGSKILDFITAI